MKAFSRLVYQLEACKGDDRLQPLEDYFRAAPPRDFSHALAILAGYPPHRLLSLARLQEEMLGTTAFPLWLLETCREYTGDLTEALSLLLPEPMVPSAYSLSHCLVLMESLRDASPARQSLELLHLWSKLEGESRFVFNRLLTGTFRLRPGHLLLARAVQAIRGVDTAHSMLRLSERWNPFTLGVEELFTADLQPQDHPRPFNFHMVFPLKVALDTLGRPSAWLASPRPHGERVQLLTSGGRAALWSETGELLGHRYPEIIAAATALPDQSIFEGHILQLCEGGGDMDPGTAAVPSRTRGRSGSHSCLLISDLLQLHGQDLRSEPLTYRLEMLVLTMQALPGLREMALAELLPLTSWDALASLAGRTTGRPRGGAFLKEAAGVYDQPGARPWMVVEAEPLRSRLILRYVALGPRGPGGLEELSLGAASPSGFVTVCKLKPSLPAAELHDLMAVIKASATERFGPVRVMPPEQVFEIEYQGVKSSARHKSGLVLLEPSLLRWCRGESADQADSMNDLRRSAQG